MRKSLMTIAVHITHEAIKKMGGIGTVLDGLICEASYHHHFEKTLLYTPLFHRTSDPSQRLGENSELLYSSIDQIDRASWSQKFEPIEQTFGIRIAYGKKRFGLSNHSPCRAEVDIVAVDCDAIPETRVNAFKFSLWEYFAFQSDRYAHDRDFEQYLRIGIMCRAIVDALYGSAEPAVFFSHEYMGMASCLASVIEKKKGIRKSDRTIFYAHEVSTVRVVVESLPGHDLSFYNILRQDRDAHRCLEDEFGSFADYSRNELIKRAIECDYVFAVSELTKEEYQYLVPSADPAKIQAVYNAIPIESVSWRDKEVAIERIRAYCRRLFNFTPDYFLTHVARLVISKGFWRDIRLLNELDQLLAARGQSAFFILLSTLIGDGRPGHLVHQMESDYGWPVLHRQGWPDLIGQEIDLYHSLEIFNAKSRAIKGVFLNQFGFNQRDCGLRLPEESTLLDLRLASDAEIGLSIYEPFGIAQLETLPYGGFPIISSACGCRGLLANSISPASYVEIDFTLLPPAYGDLIHTEEAMKQISSDVRSQIESYWCKAFAPQIVKLLPANDRQRRRRFDAACEQSHLLDWEHVVTRMADILF